MHRVLVCVGTTSPALTETNSPCFGLYSGIIEQLPGQPSTKDLRKKRAEGLKSQVSMFKLCDF